MTRFRTFHDTGLGHEPSVSRNFPPAVHINPTPSPKSAKWFDAGDQVKFPFSIILVRYLSWYLRAVFLRRRGKILHLFEKKNVREF